MAMRQLRGHGLGSGGMGFLILWLFSAPAEAEEKSRVHHLTHRPAAPTAAQMPREVVAETS